MSVPSGVTRLVTTTTQKLPFTSYARAKYFSRTHLLVLSEEEAVWLVNTETGSIQEVDHVANVSSVDEEGTLIVRSTKKNSQGFWNIFSVQ
jgi:hypothetical protein